MSHVRRAVIASGLALVALAAGVPAGAQPPGDSSRVAPDPGAAPPDSARPELARAAASADSSFDRFLQGLSDSTDRYFGAITAPLDTTGLDSALAIGLATRWRPVRARARLSYRPVYAFNRVDGSLWGASAAIGTRRWRLGADLGYAAGSDRLLGGGEARLVRRRGETFWTLGACAGRRTAGMDRDHDERTLSTLRALVSGGDRQHYLRRDGLRVGLAGQGRRWSASLQYRDELESPLPVTTRWNLGRDPLEEPTNLAATFGRNREVALEVAARLPVLPFQAELSHEISPEALGSDFGYRRTRLALGGDLAWGRHLSFLPQLVYGHLGGLAPYALTWGERRGAQVPQACFYLGGSHTLRSLPRGSLGGTGLAFARIEVIGADDLLALFRIPHPAMFPMQGAVFVASGTVWGEDPYGGRGTPTGAWPETPAWISEVGGSLLYRPGVPDEQGYFRLNYARGLGPARESRWSISYSRALDLLRSF